MSPRRRPEVDQQVTLIERLWVAALLLVAFADVLLVQIVLPLFD